MTAVSEQLVDRIIRQVMAELRDRGVAAAATVPDPSPAPAVADDSPTPSPSPTPTQKAFLTAEMLLRRLASTDGDGRSIELAPHEFLTPAALDVVDERRLAVKKSAAALPSAAPNDSQSPSEPLEASRNPTTCDRLAAPRPPATLGLVIDRPSDTVRGVLSAMSHEPAAVIDYTQTDCWIVNTRLLCEAIVGGKVGAGAVIRPHAADAMVLANKVQGIRAVQGTAVESVSAAIRQFAPNVLVIEHTLSTYHEMRAMLRMFAGGRTADAGAREAASGQNEILMDTIGKLERE